MNMDVVVPLNSSWPSLWRLRSSSIINFIGQNIQTRVVLIGSIFTHFSLYCRTSEVLIIYNVCFYQIMLGELREPAVKKTKGQPYFTPELAYILASCEERIPLVNLGLEVKGFISIILEVFWDLIIFFLLNLITL